MCTIIHYFLPFSTTTWRQTMNDFVSAFKIFCFVFNILAMRCAHQNGMNWMCTLISPVSFAVRLILLISTKNSFEVMSHVWNVTMLIYLRSIVQNRWLFFWVHDISTRIYATLLLSFPENQFSYLFVSVSVCLCRWLAAFNAHLQNSCEILQNRPVNFNYNRMTWAYFFPPASR